MRIILYTGKGGVGKTSVAAATALRAAELGHKTMVISTDTAHSLADSFDVTLSGDPQPVAPNLWGQEVNIFHEIQTHWGIIQEWVAAVMAWRGLEEIIADEIAVLPGMEELASLLHIVRFHDSNEYDLVVVDCAPTGETLRLLSFPEIARWWMERMFPLERKAASVLRPLIKPFIDMPFPKDAVFESVQNLFKEVDRMRVLLTNPDVSSVRLVVNPEKMVIKEAQRTFTYLNLYGYFTDLIICNRVIPEAVKDSYFDSWKESQGKYLKIIEENFAPLPTRNIPLLEQEAVGMPMLKVMADALFGGDDPAQVFFRGQVREIEKVDGYYLMTLPLPFVSKEDISVVQSGDELIIQAGNHRRNIILPRTLVGLPVKEAKFEGENLKIRFEKEKR